MKTSNLAPIRRAARLQCGGAARGLAATALLAALTACGSRPPAREVLWPHASEPDAAPQDDGRPTVVVGIGSIVATCRDRANDECDADGTTDSFGLLQYFGEYPIPSERAQVRVTLIDHPSEADYSVSGSVEGWVAYTKDDPGAVSLAGLGGVMMGLGGAGVAIGVPALAAAGDNFGAGALGVSLGTLVVAGAVVLASTAVPPPGEYRWSEEAYMTLRKRGKKVTTVRLMSKGAVRDSGEQQGVRWHSLDDAWDALGLRIARMIDEDLGGAPLAAPAQPEGKSP